MKTHISIGSTKSFSLSEALLIYRSTGNQESFVTLHRVEHSKETALPPTLGPAETLQPLNGINGRRAERLRTVAELYPEIADPSAGEDPLPSCSAAEALERQEPFVNQTLAASALAMLERLFRYGRISYHGAFFNAASGRMSALAVDPARWKRNRRRGVSGGGGMIMDTYPS